MREELIKILEQVMNLELLDTIAADRIEALYSSGSFYCADWNRCGSICESQCPACKKADNIPEIQPDDKWISVEERLPEVGQRVFVIVKGEFKNKRAYESVWKEGFEKEIQYWMPYNLPSPPKSKQS